MRQRQKANWTFFLRLFFFIRDVKQKTAKREKWQLHTIFWGPMACKCEMTVWCRRDFFCLTLPSRKTVTIYLLENVLLSQSERRKTKGWRNAYSRARKYVFDIWYLICIVFESGGCKFVGRESQLWQAAIKKASNLRLSHPFEFVANLLQYMYERPISIRCHTFRHCYVCWRYNSDKCLVWIPTGIVFTVELRKWRA